MSRKRYRHHQNEKNTGNYIFLILMLIFSAGPTAILFFNSLKKPSEFGRNPLGFPQTFTWSNYVDAWEQGNYNTTLPNSIILVIGTVVITMLLSGMAAYSIAKLKLPGSNILTMYFLIVSSLPMQLFLVPLFYLWRKLGLVNSLIGVIIIYVATNCAFSIFLLRSYMVQIPNDFEDAARVDGATELQVFTRVVLPLTWPGFLTAGLVVGLNVWNEFMVATVFLTDPDKYTIVTSYYNFQTAYNRDWGLTSAGAVMMVLPVLTLFIIMQRKFIEGLTQGGLKG